MIYNRPWYSITETCVIAPPYCIVFRHNLLQENFNSLYTVGEHHSKVVFNIMIIQGNMHSRIFHKSIQYNHIPVAVRLCFHYHALIHVFYSRQRASFKISLNFILIYFRIIGITIWSGFAMGMGLVSTEYGYTEWIYEKFWNAYYPGLSLC